MLQSRGGQEFFEALKKRVKTSRLNESCKVTRTGCLGGCNTVGCTVVIHADGKPVRSFNEVTMEDLVAIWTEISA